jgi:hypothetical protein
MLSSSRWLLQGALVLCLALCTSAGWRAPPLAFSLGPALRSFGGHREVRREMFAPCMTASDVDARPKVVYDTMEKTVGRTPMVRLVRMDKEGESRGNVVLAKVRVRCAKRRNLSVKSRTNHSRARTQATWRGQGSSSHASLRSLAAACSRPWHISLHIHRSSHEIHCKQFSTSTQDTPSESPASQVERHGKRCLVSNYQTLTQREIVSLRPCVKEIIPSSPPFLSLSSCLSPSLFPPHPPCKP